MPTVLELYGIMPFKLLNTSSYAAILLMTIFINIVINQFLVSIIALISENKIKFDCHTIASIPAVR